MTWPNVITLGRFLLVPVFIFAMLQGATGWAFVVFLVAGVSDAFDGYLARRFGQVSELGAYLDPLADKLLLISGFVTLGYVGAVPDWLVLLVVFRDVLIVGAVMTSHLLGRPVPVRPLMVSKLTTVVQILLVVVALGHLAGFAELSAAVLCLVWAAAGLTIASAAAYLRTWTRHMSEAD
jgi:cardiolipin synthase (CMP-forming)